MTDDKFRAFEAFRQQRSAMLDSFYLWVLTRPGWDVLEDEIAATSKVMNAVSWLPGDNSPPGGDDV